MTTESEQYVKDIFSSTRLKTTENFELQEQWINKTSIILGQLLPMKQDRYERNPHALNWEKTDKVNSFT